jgi:hypothetical protein
MYVRVSILLCYRTYVCQGVDITLFLPFVGNMLELFRQFGIILLFMNICLT